MPGFIDSHQHAVEGGEDLTRANTFDSLLLSDSLVAFEEKVQQDWNRPDKWFLNYYRY